MKTDFDYEEMFEDDYDPEDDPIEPDHYSCTCCGHVQALAGMGHSCENCGLFNVMEGENF